MSKLMIKIIELYQRTPLHTHSYCRFFPTCSEYSKQAFLTHGFLKGLFLTTKRILKCHPFGKSGVDLVPPTKQK